MGAGATRHWYVTSDLSRAVAVAEAVAAEGVSVQLRAAREVNDLEDLGKRLRAITRAAGVRFLVNRRVALARAMDADGLHIDADRVQSARELWPEAWITAPCHDDDDVRIAARGGADELLVSPIFSTPGKGEPRGVAALESARALVSQLGMPKRTRVVALGGITLANASSCLQNGADGIAAIRLFEDAADPAAVARALRGSA